MRNSTTAVIFEEPGKLAMKQVQMKASEGENCLVAVEWSGISTGTERLLWTGRMPTFPGMGYPLVPGYESVGVIEETGSSEQFEKGQRVFVPGANCYEGVHALFGGASSHLLAPSSRLVAIPEGIEEDGVLLALAATAMHALQVSGEIKLPELIVGHGVLGRLIARMVVALGGKLPTVWEKNAARGNDTGDYRVIDPADDDRMDYQTICDVSGDPTILDQLTSRLAKKGEIVLAGFYDQPLSFSYPPAFMREARIQISAEWSAEDMPAVIRLLEQNKLSLDGLLTHQQPAVNAAEAYATAFKNPECLKMVLDWRTMQ